MGVNLVVENAASQEVAAAVSTQAVLNQAEQIRKETATSQGIDKTSDATRIKELLNTNRNKSGIKCISNLLDKLSSLGVAPLSEAANKAGKQQTLNQEEVTPEGKANLDDQVDINEAALKILRQTQEDHSQQKPGSQPEAAQTVLDEEGKEAISQYPQLFSEYLVSANPELKKKLNQMEGLLEEQGVSVREIKAVQSKAANSVRQEITQQIRDAYLKTLTSKKKSIELVMHQRQLKNLIDSAFGMDKIGGGDFGGQATDLTGVIQTVVKDAKDEMADCVKDKMQELLIEQHFKNGDPKAEVKKLLELGIKCGVDIEALLQHIQQQKEHLGMNYFAAPQPPSLMGGEANQQNPNSKQNQESAAFDQDDEKEFFINSMRALCLQRAVHGDFYTQLRTSFKMRKLKNDVIRLGVTIEEVKVVEKEAVALARMELLKMLRDAYLERASFYLLEGPAYRLNERKVKSILSNLERLDFALNTAEQKEMIDAANREVYTEVLEQFTAIEAALKLQRHPGLEEKQKLLLKVAARIAEETPVATSESGEKMDEVTLRASRKISLITEAV
ncbi:MAG: hypothetical protein WC901_03060 [Candidatus Margulisiibacteriota bacterium]